MLTLIALAVAALPAPASAKSAAWSTSEQVTPSGPSYSPRLAYDLEGFAHVVFFAGPTDAEWEIFYTNNRGGAWSPPLRISDGGLGSQRNPDIAVGANGYVHVVYEKRTAAAVSDIFYATSPDLGASWQAPIEISNTPPRARAYEPAAAVDANSTLHVVWIDSRWADVLQTTYTMRPAGGTFAAPIKIGGRTFDTGPDLTTSGSGANVQIHVVYSGRRSLSTSTSDYDIWYVGGAGGTFSTPINLTNDAGVWSLTPTIAGNGAGDLYVAWDTEGSYHDIAFARSTNGGGLWSPPVNLTPRGSPSLNPALAYGLLGGVPMVHLIWTEGGPGQVVVFYLGYNPASNSFTPLEDASEAGVFEAAVAGSPGTNQVTIVYRSRSGRALGTFKGASNTIGATLGLQGGLAATRDSTLAATLGGLSGEPVQMRYALDRPPDARDPWLPLQTTFSVTAPPSSLCTRTLSVQLRNAVGRISPVLSRAIVVDGAVQAQVSMQGSAGRYGGDPAYSQGSSYALDVRGDGECVGLRYLFVDGPAPFLVDDDRFAAELPLPGVAGEGARRVTARLQDNLGNEQSYSQTIIVDRTPPQLLSGTLSADTPPGGLASLSADLVVRGLEVRDNLYPGGYWGAVVANTADPAPADSELTAAWRPVRLAADGDRLLIRSWQPLLGLVRQPGDTLAGQRIQVQVRLLDGAGNPSVQALTTTVTLAQGYRLYDTYLATVLH